MEALLTDQDLDQFIWNCIEKSNNADDFLAYLNHTNCTYAEQEAAYDKMVTYWGKKDSPKLFDKVIATVTLEHGVGLNLSKLGLKAFTFVGLLKGADTDIPKNTLFKNLCMTKNLLIISILLIKSSAQLFFRKDHLQALLTVVRLAVARFTSLIASYGH
jgi:hypothetical protein